MHPAHIQTSRRGLLKLGLAATATLAAARLGATALAASTRAPRPQASPAYTDPVLEWTGHLQRVPAPSPHQHTRWAATMHLAVFEAVNAVVGGYQPYLGTLAAVPGASPEAAAVAAAHRVLVGLHPDSAATLDPARAASLAAIPNGPARDAGVALGEAAATAMLARRADDGAAGASAPYTPGTDPGDWQPTPPAFAPAALSRWGQVTPFGIERGDQFRASPPPGLLTGAYARDYHEVRTVGRADSTARPPDRTDVARFYGANMPVYVFGETARQASVARGKTLAQNARIFALLNMALADALIASAESKFHYAFWRPVTAIRAGDADGNRRTDPDPAFLPLVTTPPYPSYPSNYASIANAARAVLEAAFGKRGHTIALPSANPAVPITHRFSSFRQMADDVDDARVYGGIHFRFDQDAGSHMGRHVGAYILHRHLRPLRGTPEDAD
jgi:hypothetical protein